MESRFFMSQPPEGSAGARSESGDGGRASGSGAADPSHQIGELAGLGLTLGLAIALFAWLGSRLDGWLGTAPLFVLIGTFIGFGGGFYSMYWRLVLKPRREGAGTRDSGSPAPPGGAGGASGHDG